MTDPEPLLRVREVARRLRLSPRTIRRYLAFRTARGAAPAPGPMAHPIGVPAGAGGR